MLNGCVKNLQCTLHLCYKIKFLSTKIRRKKCGGENYIKHETKFLGVDCALIVKELQNWYQKENIKTLSAENQLDIAIFLVAQKYAEEKLAGIFFLQMYLCEIVSWQILMNRFTGLFRKNLIYDWNVCDRFCTKVLRFLISKHGMLCAKAIAQWRNAENIWQARCSVVAFVGNTDNKEYQALILRSCLVLIKRKERFAKTAVGWIMREFSKKNEKLVTDFLHANIKLVTKEVVRNALKYYPQEQKKFRALVPS